MAAWRALARADHMSPGHLIERTSARCTWLESNPIDIDKRRLVLYVHHSEFGYFAAGLHVGPLFCSSARGRAGKATHSQFIPCI